MKPHGAKQKRGEKKTQHQQIKKKTQAEDRTTNLRCSWTESYLFRCNEPATILAIRPIYDDEQQQLLHAAATTAA